MHKDLQDCSRLRTGGYWADRISRQLEFAEFLCRINSELSEEPLHEASAYIAAAGKEQGAVTKQEALAAEHMLVPYSAEAKSFTVDCIGHAHIDMNWMWGMHETVSIVLDTFRTMLRMMDEYPEFTFAQSQASTYRIVEEYDPQLLEEIRKRVKEGRWEVTASTWTEFDKNMASGESHLRQYQYASSYISDLLDIEVATLNIGFEPDTFGHNIRLPDILAHSNIQYYYHCRGEADHTLYRWKGPEGGEVIVFREPSWYLGPAVTPLHDPSQGTLKALQMDMAGEVSKIFDAYGIRRVLQVYGVGDHGGGPTRMDIEGLRDMSLWPCYPDIAFSTFHAFFEAIAKQKDRLPVVQGEVNSIFPGCYTSQSMIKRANRESETMLGEAELFSSAAVMMCAEASVAKMHGDLPKAWQRVLFNQFHDILPGSCTDVSKAYALGLYQETYATANTVRTQALRRLADAIDTNLIEIAPCPGQRAVGAGVGFQIAQYRIAPVGSIEGPKRIVTLFNGSMAYKNEVAEIILWDWEDTENQIACQDHEGKPVSVVVEPKQMTYWQHSALRVLVPVSVPAFGYASYLLCSSDKPMPREDSFAENHRSEKARTYVMDNGIVRVVFSADTLEMISLVYVRTAEELLDGPSGFLFLDEDISDGMTAWIVGRERASQNNRFIVGETALEKNTLRQTLTCRIFLKQSEIKMRIVLDTDSSHVKCHADIIWAEQGNRMKTPQLSYMLKLKGNRKSYRYDVPFGTIERKPSPQHVPALSWVATETDASVIQLSARGKYGFCGADDRMRIILLRSSSDPDRYPEVGEHHEDFTIAVYPKTVSNKVLIEGAARACSDLQQVTHGQHAGTLPMRSPFFAVDGQFVVTAAVPTSRRGEIEIRGYETEGTVSDVSVQLPSGWKVFRCALVGDAAAQPVHANSSIPDCYSFEARPYGLYSLNLRRV